MDGERRIKSSIVILDKHWVLFLWKQNYATPEGQCSWAFSKDLNELGVYQI